MYARRGKIDSRPRDSVLIHRSAPISRLSHLRLRCLLESLPPRRLCFARLHPLVLRNGLLVDSQVYYQHTASPSLEAERQMMCGSDSERESTQSHTSDDDAPGSAALWFGQYSGDPLEEVVEKDLGYAEWCRHPGQKRFRWVSRQLLPPPLLGTDS